MPEPSIATSTYGSVTELGNAILRAVRDLGSGSVEAEVREVNVSSAGHVYFELADAESVISAVMWRGTASRVGALPKAGDLVQARFEKIDFYPPKGRTQLIVIGLAPTGEGELLRRRREVLNKLTAEGLTAPDRRTLLRAYPRKVGLVSGNGSAAAKDVITALRQRFAPIPIVFCPALVQGLEAPASVIASIATLNQVADVDVIIVARGGGSVTDLSPFDDEALCRAIFASPVPVITSIGHTKDRPVCDHVSAAQSEVPARTAELAVATSTKEAIEELGRAELCFSLARRRLDSAIESLRDCGERLSINNVTASYSEHLATASAHISSAAGRASERFVDYGRAFDRMEGERKSSASRTLTHRSEQAASLASAALDRVKNSIEKRQLLVEHELQLVAAADISKRGAIFATDDSGRLIRSVRQVRVGQTIALDFTDGAAKTSVTETNELEEQ